MPHLSDDHAGIWARARERLAPLAEHAHGRRLARQLVADFHRPIEGHLVEVSGGQKVLHALVAGEDVRLLVAFRFRPMGQVARALVFERVSCMLEEV